MSSDKLFARRRVGVCGSSKSLSPAAAELCKSIGRSLAHEANVTIVSGSTRRQAAEDFVVSAAAAEMTAEQIKERIISYVDAAQSNASEVIGTLERPRGKTSEARRISFVRGLDALIAVGGGEGTRQELALALEFGTRVLPVPMFGGAAEEVWRAYRTEIISPLRIDEETARRWEKLSSEECGADHQSVAEAMVGALLRSLPRRCFIIMPYHDALTPLYDNVLKPAIEAAGDIPIRIDRIGVPGSVTTQIEDGLRTCDYAIAVLDSLRPNVMYELGMAHGHRKTVILINRRGGFADGQVPFDIHNQQRLQYTDPDDVFREQITETMRRLETRRR
jgi:predicted Rossmann-fold nucleotide-binding protein